MTTSDNSNPPKMWIDAQTGHRVIRLTDQPGSRGLYFNVNAFTSDLNHMVYLVDHTLYLTDLQGNGSEVLAKDPVSSAVVSRNTPFVYFMRSHDSHVLSVNVSTKEVRSIGELPTGARLDSVNADGTLLAGVYVEGPDPNLQQLKLPAGMRPSKKARERIRFDAKIPMALFVFDIHSATATTILHGPDWLNHIQFSPTDPTLIMYCHEGPWNEVDRIWTIRANGTDNKSIHHRSLDMRHETAGHEFWDSDGKKIWYDLQMPKGNSFYLAGYDTATGDTLRYHMDRSQWSVHFNGDLSSGLFCGDGGSWFGAASSPDGQWIELYKPRLSPGSASAGSSARIGTLQSEKLVNLEKQDYTDEPSARFSPDHKLVIFTSNMLGPNYVFAVEVERTAKSQGLVHDFTPDVALKESAPNTEIIVSNPDGKPIANAHLNVISLDTLKPVGNYVTGSNGHTQKLFLDKDLHRFLVTCPDGSCSRTISEQITPPFAGTVSITVDQQPREYTSKSASVKIAVQDSLHTPLAKAELLVRAPDAAQEHWYTTGNDGKVSVVLPGDPSTVIVLSSWVPRRYTISSHCDAMGVSPKDPCIDLAPEAVLSIQH
jgi:oligogalacturonide lyase